MPMHNLKDTISHKDHHTIWCLLLDLQSERNVVGNENKTQSRAQELCNNSNETLSQGANSFLAQFTWMWLLEAIECLGVVALSVEMFGVALVSSMCWLGYIYSPQQPIYPLE